MMCLQQDAVKNKATPEPAHPPAPPLLTRGFLGLHLYGAGAYDTKHLAGRRRSNIRKLEISRSGERRRLRYPPLPL